MKMRHRGGMSLFGMMLVIAVVSVVATVVAPRYSAAGIHESQMDELCHTLQSLRAQIELYKAQHAGRPPMQMTDGTVVFDPEFGQLLSPTDVEGQVLSERPRTADEDASAFGPYLKRIPANPFNDSRTVVRAHDKADIPVPGGAGWAYIPETGQVHANDSLRNAGL